MFDLAKAVNSPSAAEPAYVINKGPASCTLIYQSEDFRTLIEEVFLFEGWPEPTIIKESIYSNQIDHADLNNIVLLELNHSDDVVEDARYFASQIPPHKGVIVIAKEDAISTLRTLKEMGFYYLFWPTEKQDLAEFILHVNKNVSDISGLYKSRKAKRVAVVGSKGGIGTTFIACELAFILSNQGADTILVDHQYRGSNIDVMLGMETLQRYNISEMATPLLELDDESASLYLQPVKSHLRLLAMESQQADTDVLEVCQYLCQMLDRQTNFIVEDYSASISFWVDAMQLLEHSDVVILVIEPSISSVRNARYLIESLQNMSMAGGRKIRIIPIVNRHRAVDSYELDHKEVEHYLETKVPISLAFSKQVSHWIIEGRRVSQCDKSMGRAFNDLVLLINGKAKAKTTNWLKRLMMR